MAQGYAARSSGPQGPSTTIQNGTNTYTGGTTTNPSVNISAATLSQLTVTASTVLNTLSATTLYVGSCGVVLVDFGFSGTTGGEGDNAFATVLNPYVTNQSIITCTPIITATTNHLGGDVVVEGLAAYAGGLTASTGFELVVIASQNTWGTYAINYTIEN